MDVSFHVALSFTTLQQNSATADETQECIVVHKTYPAYRFFHPEDDFLLLYEQDAVTKNASFGQYVCL